MRKNTIVTATFLLLFVFIMSSTAAAQTTIEFWSTQTEEERVEAINELIDRFEDENSDYSIDLVTVQEDDIPTRLSSGMAAGKLPDIIEVGAENIMSLGKEGTLDSEIVGEVVESIGEDNFYDGSLTMLSNPDGGHFGVPFHGWVQGIWYREDLFEEKGLEAPTNWDAIIKAAEEFYNPSEQEYGIVIGTNRDSYARQTFTQYALSNNARIFDEEGDIVFNSSEMIETLDFYSRLAEFTPPGPNGWRDARDLYLSGRVPMMMYSSYIMGDIGTGDTDYEGEEGEVVENLVDKTNFANTMEKENEAVFGQITGLSFVKSDDQDKIEGAKKFVEFLMTGDNYIDFLHMAPGGMNPVLEGVADDSKYQENEVLEAWGEKAEIIASGLNNIGKFGYVEGNVFPEIGSITSQFVVGETIMNMTENGWSAERAAEWGANQMMDAIE